eukprot:TRINITY_DN1926_c1_g1_i1.p1 TRINITY_DN1926_c1_g1~~TRINITY_DN1926_c1_g1_i1.p1  ORF type:complete len:200 (+),score=75.38 TRINITY_DN1926_c1_g1_i1:266-865(+)
MLLLISPSTVFLLETDIEANAAAVALENKYGDLFAWQQQDKPSSSSSVIVPKGQEIVDRVLFLMINEAAKCVGEGVVSNPAAIDMESIFIHGIPAFSGGLLHYADDYGIAKIVDTLNGLASSTGLDYFQPCEYLCNMAQNDELFFPKHPYISQETIAGIWNHIDEQSKPYRIGIMDCILLFLIIGLFCWMVWTTVASFM